MTVNPYDLDSYKVLSALRATRRELLREVRQRQAAHGSFRIRRAEDGDMWIEYRSLSWRDEHYVENAAIARMYEEHYNQLTDKLVLAEKAFQDDRRELFRACWNDIVARYGGKEAA